MVEPKLDIERHIKYWQRCLKTLLPTQYTSTDSNRIMLGFFILSALDILGAGPDTFPEKQRKNIRDWVLKCQHPNGGFCGSPNHRFPDSYYVDVGHGKQQMDPASLPATFFAILSLSFVGSFEQIRRDDCLKWLKTLQRDDGSFGEIVTQDGVIEGGRDMRPCYLAAGVRWMLRGDTPLSEKEKGDDIDLEKMVDYIRSGQTYDGGISESFQHEPHAGYSCCAISALSIINRLPHSPSLSGTEPQGLTNIPETIRWLVSRQVGYTVEKGEDEEETKTPAPPVLQGVYENQPSAPTPSLQDEDSVGFNGRCNKKVDTCYAYWVTASLDILGQDKAQLLNTKASRRFLLEHTQHRIGGFGKAPGDPPDIYHSNLGLATLAIMKEPGLKPFDSALCVTKQQKEIIGRLREAALSG
ncbi:terpenoid cyclases/Protein prenyltransferase [Hyaloscypha variabilis F]|uniref:Geranylgeranyl transferase type-1 subunit beta n=1 Tax=Hyaloscypha variabilis (strain UAMH 11265 / GT02V1 / F) TaxID=1149755 RepID=A0A2J6RML7_HYAVF|nr:terpenoid cyclases/Protein prenyltransferase [Hyaloscypha variabilis F]